MKKLFSLVALALLVVPGAYAQITQTVKGRVIDIDSKNPLPGVTVVISLDDGSSTGSITDSNGYFKIDKVPIGRRTIVFQFVGYEDVTLTNVIVTSGKEVNLNIEMQEATDELKETVVRARSRQSTFNEMVTVSSRSFDADEAERYAGSRQDPARMAGNFAGVQSTDDNRNDIVVRGNSPLGVLWRIEGVDVFNPNHFAVAGATGGPISLLNNKTIGNSDFLTGAFPAEYGNGISGVFDIRFRNGNYDKPEFSAQFGLFGTEVTAEGPINEEKRSSFLVAYRYATFSIFQQLNVDIGTDAVPQYQDITFKLNFPSQKGGFSVFGIGGLSKIDIVFSDDEEPTRELYGRKDRDQYFRTNMGTVGASWRRRLNNDATFNTVVAYSAQQILSDHNYIFRDSAVWTQTTLRPVQRMEMLHDKVTAHLFITKKWNSRSTSKYGVIGDFFTVNYNDTGWREISSDPSVAWPRDLRLDYQGTMQLYRAYFAHKYRISSDLTLNAGLHALYFSQSSEFIPEPRVGIKWQRTKKESYGLAYGKHSRMQPIYNYFSLDSNGQALNENIGMTRAHHIVASYDRQLKPLVRLRVEAYYQYLYNVPVEVMSSSFSLLNQGSGFDRFFPGKLENTGTGSNMGVEVTLEKYFGDNYFILANGTLYDSKYKGSDGVERNTDFNGNYLLNFLAGYELPFAENEKNAWTFGTKFTWGGGKRYSPVDTALTRANNNLVVFVDDKRNSLQFDPYMRWDLRVGFKINGKKATHELVIDLINVLDIRNALTISYVEDPDNPGTKLIRTEYQVGRLPNFYYKINF